MESKIIDIDKIVHDASIALERPQNLYDDCPEHEQPPRPYWMKQRAPLPQIEKACTRIPLIGRLLRVLISS